jgi:5'-3' exonuclease
MILVDISQLFVASTFMSMKKEETEVDIKKLRYMILNSLRMYRKKYANEFGELVICCDGSLSWRKEIFPNYKAGRKTGREGSPLDWTQIFGCFDQLKKELKENFPYRLIQVDTAEADDIIGTLVIERRGSTSKVMIISSDKDFIQLQRYHDVFQFSPVKKKLLNGVDPEEYLREHILRGDKSDGIPNVLSDDNCIVSGIRQVPLTQKLLESWKHIPIPEEHKTRVERNTALVDLRYTPFHLQEKILDQYSKEPVGSRNILPAYLTEHNLETLIKNIGDF